MTCTLPSGLRRILRRTAWVPAAAALALTACATAEMNLPVTDLPDDTGPLGFVTTGGYRAENVIWQHGHGDMLVLLAFPAAASGPRRSPTACWRACATSS